MALLLRMSLPDEDIRLPLTGGAPEIVDLFVAMLRCLMRRARLGLPTPQGGLRLFDTQLAQSGSDLHPIRKCGQRFETESSLTY